MSKPSKGRKILGLIALMAIVGAAGFGGYFKQSATLTEGEEATPAAAAATPAPEKSADAAAALAPRPADIILGDPNALNTIVEYMSMSCTHCASFHQNVVPELEKELISTGKAKLVIRHFPLNEPAIKGAMLVECAGQNGLDRKNFLKVLLDMQSKWAFNETFMNDLKQIALVGGIDSAAFDSCNADKSLETRILSSRKEGEEMLKVDSTPALFINGVKYDGDRSAAGIRKAIEAAGKPQK